MQAIKQTVIVPPSRELHIKLPEEAVAYQEAEVIVIFKSAAQSQDEKLAAMRAAANDELFLADLRETMSDFEYADREEKLA